MQSNLYITTNQTNISMCSYISTLKWPRSKLNTKRCDAPVRPAPSLWVFLAAVVAAISPVSHAVCPASPPCFCQTPALPAVVVCAPPGPGNSAAFPRFWAGAHVASINLMYNGLYKLPHNAFNGVDVTSIDLSGNNLSGRVGESSLTSVARGLQSLSLAWSRITELPTKTLRSMTQLRNLSLAENQLSHLPAELFQDLRSLQRLSLAGNPIRRLPTDIFRYQTNLDVLDLGYCHLDTISWGLFSGLWNLRRLDLRGNRLRKLAAHVFADLYSLHTLYLGHNPLRTLQSRVFSGLANLQVLHIEESKLEHLAADLFRDTQSLHTLDLGDNRLRAVELGTLFIPSLTTLSLDGNKLTELPRDLMYLRWLRNVDLSYNRLKTLDRCTIENLRNLEYLNLRENPFQCTCELFWLRRMQRMLIKKWDRSHRLPFIPGLCSGPGDLAGVGITSWIDLECLVMYYGGSQHDKCNWYW